MTRKKYSAEFKLKAVLEVLKGDRTAAQLAGELQVHPVQLCEWKKQLLENGSQIFGKSKLDADQGQEKQKSALFEQIGRLKMEIEWLKKKLGALGG